MSDTTRQLLHFTRHGELHHAIYTLTTSRNGEHWDRDHRTEEKCRCVERTGDRQALLGIQMQETQAVFAGMNAQEPTYEVKS